MHQNHCWRAGVGRLQLSRSSLQYRTGWHVQWKLKLTQKSYLLTWEVEEKKQTLFFTDWSYQGNIENVPISKYRSTVCYKELKAFLSLETYSLDPICHTPGPRGNVLRWTLQGGAWESGSKLQAEKKYLQKSQAKSSLISPDSLSSPYTWSYWHLLTSEVPRWPVISTALYHTESTALGSPPLDSCYGSLLQLLPLFIALNSPNRFEISLGVKRLHIQYLQSSREQRFTWFW